VPSEVTDFESFHEDADAGPVVVEDFEPVASFVGEDEKRSGLQTLVA